MSLPYRTKIFQDQVSAMENELIHRFLHNRMKHLYEYDASVVSKVWFEAKDKAEEQRLMEKVLQLLWAQVSTSNQAISMNGSNYQHAFRITYLAWLLKAFLLMYGCQTLFLLCGLVYFIIQLFYKF